MTAAPIDPRSAQQIRNGYNIRHSMVIERVIRARSSVNGNPAWRVIFTDGTVARTQSDASIAYCAENRDQHGVPLTVVYTRAGLIAYWKLQP
jgi:hypothetical protein